MTCEVRDSQNAADLTKEESLEITIKWEIQQASNDKNEFNERLS